jgi:hypothetical protein
MTDEDPPIDDEPPVEGEPPINDGQQEEDWDRLVAEDWLKPPYFKKDVDVWIREVQTIIREGRAKKGLPEQLIDDGCFRQLKYNVAEYIATCVMWDRDLSEADRDGLEKVQRTANNLLDAIRGLKGSDRDPTWYLEAMLRKDLGTWSLDEVTGVLEYLKQFEITSSRLRRPPHRRGRSTRPRSNLQIWVDWWWERYAELPLTAASPPYQAFLAATFGPINLSNAPSYSETATKGARRAYREERAKQQALENEVISLMVYGPEGIPRFRVERPGGTLPLDPEDKGAPVVR